MLGGLSFVKRLHNDPTAVISKLFSQSIRSSLFLLLTLHPPSRIHCLYQWYLKKYHKNWKANNYTPIAANNLWMILSMAAIFGTLSLRLELSKSKRTDIALFAFWRVVEMSIRIKCNVTNYEKDYGHTILGSDRFPAILFGVACAMAMFVNASNPNALKTLEKSIIRYMLR